MRLWIRYYWPPLFIFICIFKITGLIWAIMKIVLNGVEKDIGATENLNELITQNGKLATGVIAEVNGNIIKAPQWTETTIQEGDTVELIAFVGGGGGNSESPLTIADKTFTSRFFLGTGKFKNKTDVTESITACETEIVTVALRRIDLEKNEENILQYIPENVTLLTNTSGARNADEAIRLARLARESGYGNWVKIEVINDSKYLLPDNYETIKATEILVQEGFIVLPYVTADLYVARELVKAGAATIMPLGSLIGSNQGLKAKEFIKVLIQEIDIPIVVDAGIGAPSQAAEAMEMGG